MSTRVLVADPPLEVAITPEWFAGWVDGEGSLNIAGHAGLLQPRFRLNLRDDDGEIIRAAHAFLGVGTVHRKVYRETHRYWSPNVRDQLALCVAGRDCMRVVEILDEAPLRSKKRAEYPIWRKSVGFYASNQLTRWSPDAEKNARRVEMKELQARLISEREYHGAR